MQERIFCAVAAAIAAGVAVAQEVRRPDPANSALAVPALTYESAFSGYRPYADDKPATWREVNDEVKRLGGHMGQVRVPGAAEKAGAKSPQPPGHRGPK